MFARVVLFMGMADDLINGALRLVPIFLIRFGRQKLDLFYSEL